MILIKLYNREKDVTLQKILDTIGQDFLKEFPNACSSVKDMANS